MLSWSTQASSTWWAVLITHLLLRLLLRFPTATPKLLYVPLFRSSFDTSQWKELQYGSYLTYFRVLSVTRASLHTQQPNGPACLNSGHIREQNAEKCPPVDGDTHGTGGGCVRCEEEAPACWVLPASLEREYLLCFVWAFFNYYCYFF